MRATVVSPRRGPGGWEPWPSGKGIGSGLCHSTNWLRPIWPANTGFCSSWRRLWPPVCLGRRAPCGTKWCDTLPLTSISSTSPYSCWAPTMTSNPVSRGEISSARCVARGRGGSIRVWNVLPTTRFPCESGFVGPWRLSVSFAPGHGGKRPPGRLLWRGFPPRKESRRLGVLSRRASAVRTGCRLSRSEPPRTRTHPGRPAVAIGTGPEQRDRRHPASPAYTRSLRFRRQGTYVGGDEPGHAGHLRGVHVAKNEIVHISQHSGWPEIIAFQT